MNLSSEQILERWNILIEFIEQHFEGNQKENILSTKDRELLSKFINKIIIF